MVIAVHVLRRREGDVVFAACGRSGRGLMTSTVPSAVTCPACKARRDGRERIRTPPPKPKLERA